MEGEKQRRRERKRGKMKMKMKMKVLDCRQRELEGRFVPLKPRLSNPLGFPRPPGEQLTSRCETISH